MIAAYSKELSDKAAQSQLRSNRSGAGNVEERAARRYAVRERRHSDYLDALRTVFEAWGQSRLVRESIPVFETIDWTEIDEKVSIARPIEFAHPSEEEFAQALDDYGISWRYKARTFAVEWDEEGNFVDCFTPDFYLPESQMYIALAPDRASNAKTRKVSLLRRQHPEIRIELLHGARGR